MGVPLCFPGGDPPSGCLPRCAGDSIAPGTQPLTQGRFKGSGVAARSVGKRLRAGPGGAGSSTEMLLGMGRCGGDGTTPGVGWETGWGGGLRFASGLFIPEITRLLPSPQGNGGAGVALGQAEGPGQGRGSMPRGDQSSCTLGNSLGQQT